MKLFSIKPKSLLVAGVISGLMLVSVPAAAADVDYVQVRQLQKQGQILSFEKISEYARAAKPGDILETELELKKGRYIYEVEILDEQGVVWELKLDAKTGELIKIKLDD